MKRHLSSRPGAVSSRPRLAGRVAGLTPSLYARLLSRLSAYQGEKFPFHIGESHLLPPPQVAETLKLVNQPTIHHYGHPAGLLSLRTAVAARFNRFPASTKKSSCQTAKPSTSMNPSPSFKEAEITPEEVVITHGATHALSLACAAILDPGDIMLVLSPHWPLINAMVHANSAVPIEVPFTTPTNGMGHGSPGHEGQSSSRAPIPAYDILKRSLQQRTRAVYLSSPNNPDGVILTETELAEVARFCVEHDLYVLVDEAYESFDFREGGSDCQGVGAGRMMMSMPGMRDRTISIFTLSKSHRMAGLRVGYAIAPPDIRDAMVKLANISVYNVSLLTQQAAEAALTTDHLHFSTAREAARDGMQLLTHRLSEIDGLRFERPEGGAYVFMELSEVLAGRDCFDLLDVCLDEGVMFAPGIGFGAGFSSWARLCFTTMAPEQLNRGIDRLMTVMERYRRQGQTAVLPQLTKPK